MEPRPDRAIGPFDPDFGRLRAAESHMDPAELPTAMASADGQLAPDPRLPRPGPEPAADRVAVRAGLADADGEPRAHRRWRRRRAAADVPPEPDRRAEIQLDEIEQPVEVEVRE